MQIGLLMHRTKRLAIIIILFLFFLGEGGGRGKVYHFNTLCGYMAMYMCLQTILWWYIVRFATLVTLGTT